MVRYFNHDTLLNELFQVKSANDNKNQIVACTDEMLGQDREHEASDSTTQDQDDSEYQYKDCRAFYQVKFEREIGYIPKKLNGAKYIEKLLQKPGHSFPAIELRGGVESTEANVDHDTAERRIQIQELRNEAIRVKKEIDTARESKDEPKQERLLFDLEEIEKAIKPLIGLGGRVRSPVDSQIESARSSVQQSLKSVIDRCREEWHLSAFADHLEKNIHTGKTVLYQPSSPEPPWKF